MFRLSACLVPEVPMLKRTIQHADNDSALVQARVPPGPRPGPKPGPGAFRVSFCLMEMIDLFLELCECWSILCFLVESEFGRVNM